jgi:hypothetical protein
MLLPDYTGLLTRGYHTTHLVSGGRTIAEPALHENVSANGGKFDSGPITRYLATACGSPWIILRWTENGGTGRKFTYVLGVVNFRSVPHLLDTDLFSTCAVHYSRSKKIIWTSLIPSRSGGRMRERRYVDFNTREHCRIREHESLCCHSVACVGSCLRSPQSSGCRR